MLAKLDDVSVSNMFKCQVAHPTGNWDCVITCSTLPGHCLTWMLRVCTNCLLLKCVCLWCMQVSKLARQLPVGDVKAMAGQLGSGQMPAAVIDTSDLNEEDLT